MSKGLSSVETESNLWDNPSIMPTTDYFRYFQEKVWECTIVWEVVLLDMFNMSGQLLMEYII